MLTYEPSKRISARDAISHPFFDELKQPRKEAGFHATGPASSPSRSQSNASNSNNSSSSNTSNSGSSGTSGSGSSKQQYLTVPGLSFGLGHGIAGNASNKHGSSDANMSV